MTPTERLDLWKMAYGFFLTSLIVGLAAAIALGKVNKESSYGLDILLTPLAMLLGQWITWLVGSRRKDEPGPPPE